MTKKSCWQSMPYHEKASTRNHLRRARGQTLASGTRKNHGEDSTCASPSTADRRL